MQFGDPLMPLADILYVYIIYILYIIQKQEANYNIYSQIPLLRKNECKSKDKMYKKKLGTLNLIYNKDTFTCWQSYNKNEK